MKKNAKNKKETISYEQIIAGLLLKLDKIDNVDFSLLIGTFKEKTKIKIEGLPYYFPNIGKYIVGYKNGSITLKEGINLNTIIKVSNYDAKKSLLDNIIKDKKCSVKKKLMEVAGEQVKKYIESLDIENYRKAKEKRLLEKKEKMLEQAQILLISNVLEDYNSMRKYGFKNIDYFKSVTDADHYFKKHSKQLEKYQIIIESQNVQRYYFNENFELERKINALRNKKNILKISLQIHDYIKYTEYVVYLEDKANIRSWEVREGSYSAIFDRIIENTLINHIMENKNIDNQRLKKYIDHINSDRITLPKKKSDLKILYLDSISVMSYGREIAESLGLNITFKEDNNSSLEKNVKDHLGDYDIIIASHIYSGDILEMANESTKQCKATGRKLTLLVTYETEGTFQIDEDDNLSYGEFGNKVKLQYVYGGENKPDGKLHEKEFKVAIENGVATKNTDRYFQGQCANMKSIIESSVYAYNDALLQQKKILDLDFKTAEEYDKEYILREEQEELRKENALAPINAFDEIRYAAISYLQYKRNEQIIKTLEGLKITEDEKSIRIENSYNGKVFCALTFLKEYKERNIRIFEVERLSKKGILLDPEKVGVYTRKYETIEGVPNRPDEKQLGVLLSIQKKVKSVLKPINEEIAQNPLKKVEQKIYKKK